MYFQNIVEKNHFNCTQSCKEHRSWYAHMTQTGASGFGPPIGSVSVKFCIVQGRLD